MMTEKRYSHDAIVIVDHLKKDLIYIDGKDELLELAEYVDRLQEENTTLMEENEQLKSSDTITDLETEIMKLKQENEQLKQQNQSWLKTASHLDTIAHEDRDYAKRMHKENEQLKQFKQNVFGLIDKNIEKDKHEYEMTYEDYLNGRIEVLEELKKELEE